MSHGKKYIEINKKGKTEKILREWYISVDTSIMMESLKWDRVVGQIFGGPCALLGVCDLDKREFKFIFLANNGLWCSYLGTVVCGMQYTDIMGYIWR